MRFIYRSVRIIFSLIFLSVMFLSNLAMVTPVSAATIVVDTTVDEDVDNETCSLREAIRAANSDSAYKGCDAGSGADTITLSAETYTIDDQISTFISTDITILGQGPNATIIQASS